MGSYEEEMAKDRAFFKRSNAFLGGATFGAIVAVAGPFAGTAWRILLGMLVGGCVSYAYTRWGHDKLVWLAFKAAAGRKRR